jgi:Skp family chaperone for outer membrane proteins
MQGVLHVKFSHLAATVAAAVVAVFSLVGPYQAPAQAQGGRAGHNIAVVDVSVVFKKHVRFLAMVEKFKKDVQTAEANLKKEYEQIKALQEGLKAFTPGSPEYKQMEQRIARSGADWQLKQQTQKKDLMDYEGQIYFQVYKELDDAVKLFAQKHNIALVLRFASEPVDDPNNRNEIVRGINKSVIYVNPELDITLHILQDLNRSAAVTGANTGPAGVVAPPQRQGVAPRPGVQR